MNVCLDKMLLGSRSKISPLGGLDPFHHKYKTRFSIVVGYGCQGRPSLYLLSQQIFWGVEVMATREPM